MIKPVLILGIGNMLMSDDGAGVHLLRYLENVKLPDSVELLDGGTGGVDLMPVLKGREKVIILDAVKSNSQPGNVSVLSMEDILKEKIGYSLHNSSVTEAIGILKMFGDNPSVKIIGIEPQDVQTPSEKLSEPVRAAIPRAAELVLEAVKY